MDQSQQAAVLTAGLLFFMVTIVFLIARFNIKTRRTWLALDSTQQRLIMTCTAGFVLWVLSAKAVRPWASAIGFEHHWSLDVAPSLTAGITVTGYVAFLLTIFHRLKILCVFLIGAALMLLFEVIQIWLSDYVFDSLDVLAGTIGAAVVTLVLLRDSRAYG
jgi:hypothetical protein